MIPDKLTVDKNRLRGNDMSKKEQIRTMAIELFAAKGYYAVSTPMIAEAARVSTGTIYNYFKNKEEILNFIFSVEHQKCETLLSYLDNLDLPIMEKLSIFINRYSSLLLENPNNNKVIVGNSRYPSNQKLEYVDKFINKLPLFFVSMLNKALINKEISEVNPDLTGPAIFYMIRGMAYTVQNSMDSADYGEAMEELRDFIKAALKVK
jgi:TetR/AcrR family fatty acid metabolism transcriptional regulator